MIKLKILDLFSGIGGFSLGLERTGGFETAAFCEFDQKARLVLQKHWPDVPMFDDVRTLTKEKLDEQRISVDVICGGFPCQDISLAGKGAGLAGERSGLWFEFHRLIKEIRPSWVIAENVSALRSRGLDQVLRSLAEIGYDAEWHCIPASAVGAPHRRDRIWIVAYPSGGECNTGAEERRFLRALPQDGAINNNTGRRGSAHAADVADAESAFGIKSAYETNPRAISGKSGDGFERGGSNVADPKIVQRNGRDDNAGKRVEFKTVSKFGDSSGPTNVADALREGLERQFQKFGKIERPIREAGKPILGANSWSQRAISWAVEPDVGRVAHGVPKRVDRLKQLGNAVVPQIPEIIGYAILENIKNGTP